MVPLSPCLTFKNVSIVLQVVLEHFSFVFKEDLCEKYDWDAELEDLSESVWASSVQITTVLWPSYTARVKRNLRLSAPSVHDYPTPPLVNLTHMMINGSKQVWSHWWEHWILFKWDAQSCDMDMSYCSNYKAIWLCRTNNTVCRTYCAKWDG